ncbi:MAG: hypothetical protein V9E83_06950 [Baekduia sp.]
MRLSATRFLLGLAIGLTALAVVSPNSAEAAVRTATLDDARDVRLSISPPNMPDLRQLSVSYDDAGTVTVTVSFFEDTRSLPSAWHATEVSWILGRASGTDCDYIAYPESKGYFTGRIGINGTGSAQLSGFEGKLTPTSFSWSPDHLTATAVFSNPNLAGRDYQCVTPGFTTWVRSTASNPYSNYGVGCDCWYVGSSQDGDALEKFWFAGLEPASRPAPSAPAQAVTVCTNGVDDDGDGVMDLLDPGCKGEKGGASEIDPAPVASKLTIYELRATKRCRLDVAVEVTPDLEPVDLFPFGKVQIRVRGVSGTGRRYDKTRRLPLGDDPGYAFKLKSGTYRVSASYRGDRFRKSSTTKSRTVRVCRRPR